MIVDPRAESCIYEGHVAKMIVDSIFFFPGFPGYQVQPMFMGGQVMSQQNPGMLVHGQQSLGQPSFSSPYQTYPPVQPG